MRIIGRATSVTGGRQKPVPSLRTIRRRSTSVPGIHGETDAVGQALATAQRVFGPVPGASVTLGVNGRPIA